jgi:hypothetical protein
MTRLHREARAAWRRLANLPTTVPAVVTAVKPVTVSAMVPSGSRPAVTL